MTVPNLGRVGIWSMELRFGDPGAAAEAAAELDELGYGAIWFPGGIGGDVTGDFSRLLNATKRTTLATGIINLWKHEPAEIAAWWNALSDDHKARALLGIGISHGPLIGENWGKPIPVTRDWVERLTALGVPADNQCLAALGPKMVALSRDRTAGAHPYLVTPEHSAIAREILGPDKLLAPEQGVVLESDPTKARDLARAAVDHYRALPNYRSNWVRLGIAEEDIEAMSDSFIDALFAWGGVEQIAARVKQHHDAGADHVCLQVIAPQGAPIAEQRRAWREIAEALL
ncbi:MAG: TIGR03620 family F420-dependent LLM class oxidoreductase [Novosphingobium sp.]|nr:MAG: TIGR03620 family F420-dependent LLM class oxidoreductase [Novosphingobium sp.]